MARKTSSRHAGPLGWDDLEEILVGGTVRGVSRGAAAALLGNLFDETELKALRRLAEHARLVRSRSPVIGNVIFLHGITGADLASVDIKGSRDSVWVDIPRLIEGRLADLRLDAAGKEEADPQHRIEVAGINKTYYARSVFALQARWNVETYAYDWRKDIDEASEGLKTLIRKKFAGKPVHLVAHAMGGLVARNFIRQNSLLWESMKDGELVAGGRLVMLGTPNYGSYAIPRVLTGEDQMMGLLERIDLKHNMSELLAITNTFPGLYMLLPAPSKLPPALRTLYQRDTWGNIPGISQEHLNRAYQFCHDLERGSTIDPTRMLYVAGCRHATITSMSIVAPGEFEYGLSYRGDGRVPHALGLLPDVPTYYVEEVHGDLARNEQVMRAVDEMLETGRTSELVTTVLHGLERAEPKMRDYRTAADRRLMEELEGVARKARAEAGAESLSEDEQRHAADAIVKAALGTSSRSLPKALIPAAAIKETPQLLSAVAPVELEVAAHFADVTRIKTPLVVVGHYRGVRPVNAIGAIDAALQGWITRAVKQGMIAGTLGETFFVPTRGRLEADGVVVAGMGDYGYFTPTDLRRLMANVAVGAAALQLRSIATVLVGAGAGALDRDTALRELLEGIGTGLTDLREETGGRATMLKQLVIIENNPLRFFELIGQLRLLAQDGGFKTIKLKFSNPLPAEERRARSAEARAHTALLRGGSAAEGNRDRTFDEVRLTVEQGESDAVFRFSALTKSAVAPVRDVLITRLYADEAAHALRTARTRDEQEKFGRLLYTYLMPEDFHEYIDGPYPVRLVVDRSTAAFPWEMACFPGRGARSGLRWLGTDLALSRQFRTLLSSAPGVSPPLNDKLRVLVIADPAPERELQLQGARTEGRRVVELFKYQSGREIDGGRLDIEVEQRIGPGECELVEILALILSGDFDILHFSGHGDYNRDSPDASGWVFGRDRVLTARDIFRARKAPRLVFANACFSGVLRGGEAFAADELSRGLATIAEAFLERGVPNYIGTGWPVDDMQALTMAETFYKTLLSPQTIGKSLQEARQKVFAEQIESSWGAYQHYGNPSDTVLRTVDPVA